MNDTYDPDAILADANAHPVHRAYAAINVGIRDRGERWAKCANCGEPYRLTPEWGVGVLCSSECEEEYGAYLSSI